MGDIYLYAVAFIPKLWPLVSAGGLLGFEEFAERYWLWASRWLKRIPEKRRRHIKVATLFFATILSGFLAWSDEHKARLEAERAKFTSFERPNDLSSTIDRASKDTAADRPLRGLSNAQLRDS
ncbi:MAG TPA: hypothetical protein VEF36_17510, partial [Roseiarcus sp.]|nr:hypothetical protein [Roseiarcus sp.]